MQANNPSPAFCYLVSAKSSGLDGLNSDSLISRSIFSLPKPLYGSAPKVHISHMSTPKDLEKEGFKSPYYSCTKNVDDNPQPKPRPKLNVKIMHMARMNPSSQTSDAAEKQG